MNNKILIVDDDKLLLSGIKRRYGNLFQLNYAFSGKEALELLENGEKFAVIMSDYYMPGMNGIEFLTNVSSFNPEAVKVLITGNADVNMAIDAVNMGNVFRFLCKPILYDVMTKVIKDCLLQYRLINIEKTEKLKSDIISILSHEIRTPVTAINNNLFLIKKGIGTENFEKNSEYFNKIETINEKLVMSVNKIDYLSKLLSDQFKIKKSNVNLITDVVNPLINDFTKNNKNFKILLNCDFEDFVFFLDKTSIHQIILELLDNAYKFSNGEEVQIELKDREEFVELIITDTGLGISNNFDKISEPFYQEDNGSSRMFNGNGLGLTLVKKLCKHNEIKIEYLENTPKGTSVKLIFNKRLVCNSPNWDVT